MVQEPVQYLAEPDIETTLIRIDLTRIILLHFHLDQMIAEKRRHHDGNQPGEQQGNTDNREQCLTELTGHSLCKSNRDKAGAGNQRTGEHRLGRCPERVAGCLETIQPHLQLDAHHLNRDDRIIDQQPQCNDKRAERYLMQVDAQHVHETEHASQHERDTAGHDHACAHPQ